MSGTEFILDTNIVIGLLKNAEAAVDLAQRHGLVLARAGVSQITRMELLGFPGLEPDEERVTLAFLSHCRVIGIDDQIEAIAIGLRRSGVLKLPDAVIAATALAAGARLLTLDERLAKVVGERAGRAGG